MSEASEGAGGGERCSEAKRGPRTVQNESRRFYTLILSARRGHALVTALPPAGALASLRALTREHAADRWVHLLGLGLGLPAAVAVITVAAIDGAWDQLAPVALYAVGLLAMLGCSAAYHLWRSSTRRDWLRRLDHAAIFAMIAGTYTPFTLRLERAWADGLTAAIWALAAAGITVKLMRPRPDARLHALGVMLYLALGWIGLLALGPFTASLATATLILLAVGGALYSAGVIFHLWQRLPYQNAIWHGFVLVAAGVHYAAVWTILGA